MKRLIALMLATMMCFSFAACGGSGKENPDADTNADSAEINNDQEMPVGNWVSLYSNGKLTLNSDNTMTLGENSGTWSQDGSCLTFNYTVQSNGNSMEVYYDIVEENGTTLLRSRKAGKTNGSTANFSIDEYYPEEKIEEVKRTVAKTIGDTVSTDIMEVTVNKAELSYYAIGATTSVGSGKTVNVEEACSPSESGGFYTANKGRTLVCLDFTLTNTDRGKLNTSDYIISFSVKQNNDGATINGYDLNSDNGRPGLNLSGMPIAINGQDFVTNDTSNEIISAGDSVRIKYVGIIGFDADLSAPFELVVDIDNSDGGSEKFIYTVG